MSDKRWFLLIEEQVQGPFSKSEIEDHLIKNTSAHIWWRGQAEWVSPDLWRSEVEKENNPTSSEDLLKRTWLLKVKDQELEPMNHEQMMAFLKQQNDLSEVQIWTEGYSSWKEVFQIHKIMDELGVSRRKHPRVPIRGHLIYEINDQNLVAELSSISEGGLGATKTSQISIGNQIKAVIQSPQLFQPIHATCEVVYMSSNGYAGMRFSGGLHLESKAAIIEYIKKFPEQKN